MVRADGSSLGAFDVILERAAGVLELAFTPDGEGVIFREGNANTGAADLGFLNLETGEVNDSLLASRFNERAIALSPDGRWLAYVSDVTGRDEIFVRPFPSTGSGQRQISTNSGLEPRWAHSGEELFYREPASGSLVVASVAAGATLAVTARTPLFDASSYALGQAGSWHSYNVTRDDQRFLFMRPSGVEVVDDSRLILVQNWLTELRDQLGRGR
jgi:hypothetical protein